MIEKGLPDGFCHDEVRPACNKMSGYVFLTNSEYQVVMINGENLELFHHLPYSGYEGFLEDILNEKHPDDLHRDDVEFVLDAADVVKAILPVSWSDIRSKFQMETE